MKTKILYDFYLNGYDNGIEFAYVPDFDGVETIQAYTKGLNDAKENREQKTIFEFEQSNVKPMKTQYTKAEFNLTKHREFNGSFYLSFLSPDTTHRLGGLVHNGIIGIKTDSCNKAYEKCHYRSALNSWIKYINGSKGNFKQWYYPDTTVIKFDSIEKANNWFNSMYDLITSNPYGQLSLFLNQKQLPKDIIMFEYQTEASENNFKLYQVNNDFSISDYVLPLELQNKYKNEPNSLYYYDFESMTMQKNLNSTVWIK